MDKPKRKHRRRESSMADYWIEQRRRSHEATKALGWMLRKMPGTTTTPGTEAPRPIHPTVSLRSRDGFTS